MTLELGKAAPHWVNHLLTGRKFLDVRAPIEFVSGHLPGAENLPILNDEERAAVGTTYKQEGPNAALTLGHQLVSGEVRAQRVRAWQNFFSQNSDALLYCFRGGQRSQIAQSWLSEIGVKVSRIEGGYKAVRTWSLNVIHSHPQQLRWLCLTGLTGSGKTELLARAPLGRIDLEHLARHRGSAYGEELEPQPAQATFEITLAAELFRQRDLVLIEDESRTIGKIVLPESIFRVVRSAPLIVLEEPQLERAKRIQKVYVEDTLTDLVNRYSQAVAWKMLEQRLLLPLQRIQSRLGGARFRTAEDLVRRALAQHAQGNASFHLDWIVYLLENYYDPVYQRHLNLHEERVIMRGNRDTIGQFLDSQAHTLTKTGGEPVAGEYL